MNRSIKICEYSNEWWGKRRGASHSLFANFYDCKIWYYRLHIVLGDVSEFYTIRITFKQFQCDFSRFQALFVNIRNRRLKSGLSRFYMISYDCILDFEWSSFNDFTSEWPLGKRRNLCEWSNIRRVVKRVLFSERQFRNSFWFHVVALHVGDTM